jgi:hypothetical protein
VDARIVEDVILPEVVSENARFKQWNHILTAEFNQDGLSRCTQIPESRLFVLFSVFFRDISALSLH